MKILPFSSVVHIATEAGRGKDLQDYINPYKRTTQIIVYTIRMLFVCLLVGGSAMSSSPAHQLRITQAILQINRMLFVVVC